MADYSLTLTIHDNVLESTMEIHGGVQKLPNYTGSYTVTPSAVAQTLATKDKSMTANVTVNATPVVTVDAITITENGTTTAPTDHAYSPVTVAVPVPTIESLTVTENGTTTAPSGTAYGTVTVAIPETTTTKSNIDSSGVVTSLSTLTATNIKTVRTLALRSWQAYNTYLTSVNLYNLEQVDINGMAGAFQGCTYLTTATLHALKTIGRNGFSYTFQGCSRLTGNIDLSLLETVAGDGMASAFDGSSITGVDLSSLKTLDSNGMKGCFRQTSLSTISFPALTSISSSAFQTYCFTGCSSLTEIHFRSDMQSTVEALSGYSTKFGATNATIYFDL